MYSPFYTAEQKRLYPHRDITIQTQTEAESYFKALIAKGIITSQELSKISLGVLKLRYMPNCDHWTILAAMHQL